MRDFRSIRTTRFMGMFRLIGRLAPGVSFEAGREQLRAVTMAQGIHGDDGTPVVANYQSLREFLLGDKRTPAVLMPAHGPSSLSCSWPARATSPR